MLRHHRIEYDALIAYHDTRRHKPDPEPVLAALRKLQADADAVLFALGDSFDDWRAYSAANVRTIGAGWSPAFDASAEWNYVLQAPAELIGTIRSP
jgi:phosphoglycolate phosphatase-like HAD superfamily hydrolase